MVELKRIGVVSLAKIFAVGGAVGGLISGLSSGALLSTLTAYLPIDLGLEGIVAIIVFGIMGLIGGAIFGFLYGALTALIYNLIAGLVGGVDVTFTKNESPGAMPAQTRRETVANGAAGAAGAAGAQPKSSGVATAVNPELLNYVKGELAAGRPKDEVVADLVKAGWSQDDIHAALNAAVLG